MLWLLITIVFYFILAIVFLIDKHLLVARIPDPRAYTFYVGTLGIMVLLISPFVGFETPSLPQIALALLAGSIYIFALFWFFKGLQLFEASRVVPAIGGFSPIFTLGLIYIFSLGKETLASSDFVSFLLLVSGSVLITLERDKNISLKNLKLPVLAAFLLSLSFVLSKYVFLNQPFWSGYIWIRIGGFLMAILFFVSGKKTRKSIISKKQFLPKKTIGIFLSNQTAGAGANILQNWAFALAPLAYVAVINALQGIQYAFLLIFTIFLSLKFPKILEEKVSRKALFQKIISIFLIAGGLIILTLK